MASNQNSSAGVYTNTNDYSYTTPPLSSSVYAVVGESSRGPINQRIKVLSGDDYAALFGARNPKYGWMGYVVGPVAKYSNQGIVVRIVNGAKHAVATLSVDSAKATSPKIALTNYVDSNGNQVGVEDVKTLGFLPTAVTNGNVLGYFRAENPGAWNNGLAIAVVPDNPRGLDPIADRNLYNPKQFRVQVWENYVAGAAPVEEHLVTFDYNVDEFNKQTFICDVLETNSTRIRFIKNDYFTANIDFVTSAFVYMGGGSDGIRCTEDMYATAIQAHFSDPESIRVNLLVDTYGGYIVHNMLARTAKLHVNCHALSWCPNTYKSVAQIVNYRQNTLNINTSKMSLHTGAVIVYDTDTKRKLTIPSIGFVAAAFADMDNRHGSWFAPAGIDASASLDILGLETVFDQEDRDALTRAQVNYIRKMPEGADLKYALWEAQTLYNLNSAFQNIHIERLTGYVLDYSQRISRRALFDPNDAVLREQVKTWIETVLTQVRNGGGLRTLNGSAGFQVICDSTNNSDTSIANGDLVVDMVLDPANIVRRLHVRFNINPKGSTATNITAV
jgi:hypothetical protein